MKRLFSLLLVTAVLLSSFITANAEEDAPEVPRVIVTTADGNGTSLEKADGYVDAEISIVDTDNSTLSGSVTFKVRGNSTALVGIPKKAYTFKFPKKQNVLGLDYTSQFKMVEVWLDGDYRGMYTLIEPVQTDKTEQNQSRKNG